MPAWAPVPAHTPSIGAHLVRVDLFAVLCSLLLSTVVAAGGPMTGPLEKAVLVVVFFGLLGLSVPVHRIGRGR